MSDASSDSTPRGAVPGDEERNYVAVERAIGELRRGRPVLVTAGATAVFIAAVEIAGPATLDRLAALSGAAPVLALTANRAAVLHITPTGDEAQLLAIPAYFSLDVLRSVADPTRDLGTPFRGPFHAAPAAVVTAHRAALRLLKAARLLPAGLVSVGLARPAAERAAVADDCLVAAAAAIDGYEDQLAVRLRPVAAAHVPLEGVEDARIIAFRPDDGGIEHLAIVIGDPLPHEPVLIRLHSECFTGDLLRSLKCDCGDQLRGALAEIAHRGAGVLLYLAQEGRGIGLINKLKAYSLQDQGFDTVDANERLGFLADERLFRPAAEMLKRLGFIRVRLMTNNPDKVAGLAASGVEVVERVSHAFPSNGHNEFYLLTKKKRSGHYL